MPLGNRFDFYESYLLLMRTVNQIFKIFMMLPSPYNKISTIDLVIIIISLLVTMISVIK